MTVSEVNLLKVNLKELETERLILKSPTPDNLESILDYAADPLVVKYLIMDIQTSDSVKTWLSKIIVSNSNPTRELHWTICLKETRQLIGTVGLKIGLENNPFCAVFGYALAKKYWGVGYMTEALKALVDFAYKCKANLNSLHIPVLAPNLNSANVALKLGFTQFGPLKNRYFVKGQFFDQLLHILTKDDWLRQKSTKLDSLY